MARYESYPERLVREAIERGEFDNLPGAGQPLRGLTGRHDPNWWIRHKLRDENLTGAMPEPLRLRREREDLVNRLSDFPTETELRQAVSELNDRIRGVNSAVHHGPGLLTRPLDEEAVVSRWRVTAAE